MTRLALHRERVARSGLLLGDPGSCLVERNGVS